MSQSKWSLPSRERGLKFFRYPIRPVAVVAPFTGAWIEISPVRSVTIKLVVAPFTGAWIEIFDCLPTRHLGMSLPSRERGLKYDVDRDSHLLAGSLPSRERGLKCCVRCCGKPRNSRSLHGSVD